MTATTDKATTWYCESDDGASLRVTWCGAPEGDVCDIDRISMQIVKGGQDTEVAMTLNEARMLCHGLQGAILCEQLATDEREGVLAGIAELLTAGETDDNL